MQIGSSVAARLAVVLLGLIVSAAAPARAIDFTLQVLVDGVSAGPALDATALGCSDTGGVTEVCNGQDITLGGLEIDLNGLTVKEDPFINGMVAVVNNNLGTQQFTMIFTLGVLPTLLAPTSMFGEVNGGLTDSGDGGGASLSAPTGSALFTGRLNGTNIATAKLYSDPFSLDVLISDPPPSGEYGSKNLPYASFGFIPTGFAPTVTSIGLQYDFNLTGGDLASFTGRFEVVPEPTTALLVGLGLATLAIASRRR